MNDQYASIIYDAVCLDSVELLKANLLKHDDMDINMDISSALPKHEDVVTKGENGREESCYGDYYVAQHSGSLPTLMTALQVAMVRYHCCVCRSFHYPDEKPPQVDMIQFLLRNGANLAGKCRNISLLHLMGLQGRVMASLEDVMVETLSLVKQLIRSSTDIPTEEQGGMKPVMDLLTHPCKPRARDPFPTAKLLLSEKHSDVTFVCSDDETKLHAHKCILSSSSDFFDTYFDGPWAEQHPDGEWKTKFTSDVMKAFLTFVYTGTVTFDNKDEDDEDAGVTCAQRLMKLAHEWDLPELFCLAEVKCTMSLLIGNFPTLMTEAEVYNAEVLKHQCVKFLRKNFVAIVMKHPHLTSTLASDYPELWEELSDEMEPEQKRQRRT